MPLIIAARGTERWRAGEREGRRSERVRGGHEGALVCKPDTLAVTVNKLTERETVREGDVRVRERKEGNQERGNKRGRRLAEIKSDGEKEGKERERESREKRSSSIRGVRLHLCMTPGCYRASVYGLLIPLPPITTQ